MEPADRRTLETLNALRARVIEPLWRLRSSLRACATVGQCVVAFDAFLRENGYANDFSGQRMHHEIYLSDARRVPPEKWKTVIRHPIRKL